MWSNLRFPSLTCLLTDVPLIRLHQRAAITAVDGVASYNWDFGNGFIFNGQTPPPQIYAAGVYNVSLTITTNGGCTATSPAGPGKSRIH